MPSAAQAQDADMRLRKLEAEVTALQRKVFPDGGTKYFTPEVNTAPAQPAQTIGTPSTSVVTDILARLDALENQLTQLTARSEENSNKINKLQAQLEAMTAERAAATSASSEPVGVMPLPGNSSSAAAKPTATQPVAAAPSQQRVDAVKAIVKPSTDDAGDDEYTYGYRLWDAGFFPEAEQQLALFLKKYPSHWRTSYGRNLLGRAYLDDNKPREAAPYFLENYQSDKQGVRAPDSLLYLAESMIKMGDTNRACIALAEFGDTYPALATGRLKQQYDTNRSSVTCK
ncbi:tetratricopeptide repeat protein [Altererythrobacter indicus]|uniref:Tetratricopeptide repeat protein n=2 Tax=Altericroceibacterium indicum TaxID=374177 RepID=A0A845A5L5_9SPHN|nr:tetratricopeptide repeat protein [Altericroceibacterium indicum]MXP24563.1 tetratricopeptide repeat protein [Altericroceibacterium indicum]